jgi:hypothetical protein
MLRVFGRLPVTAVMRYSRAGVGKASREETAEEFAPAVVSVNDAADADGRCPSASLFVAVVGHWASS